MDCCKCPQLTEINANFDYCGRHRHEFCGNCRHWDPNEDEELHLDLKKKIEENDDSDEDYVIENTEANKKALSKQSTFFCPSHNMMLTVAVPMNALLEPVAPEVTDELELTAAEVVAKLKLFERITNLIPELQRMILSSFLSNVKPRDVRVIWDHFRQQWTYRCFSGFGTNSFANTIPAMVWNASGNSRVAATNFFDPAPTFGDLEPYRYFNFDQDQLVLDYRRCGNTSRDTREYSRAMYNAATALVEHHNNPGAPQLRFLTFTWCPETDNPRGILSILNGITSLERVIVEAHDHYDDPITNYRNATGRYQRDEKEMEYFSTRLGTYHFEVEFINHWGVSCKAEESEEELEQEDDGYEVDDDFWVPDWG